MHQELIERLQKALHAEGFAATLVRAEHARELHQDIERRRTESFFSEQFFQEPQYQDELTGFSIDGREVLPDARSIMVVACPQPQIRLTFTYRGRSHTVLIPPHYVRNTDARAERTIRETAPEFDLARAVLPLKLLAARSGLARYGRNNICYVPGMGSFHRLVAYYTDLACTREKWGRPQMLNRCIHCRACSTICPTEAIPRDRFLLHADRCLTFHNERPVTFPSWIDPSWHNCLIRMSALPEGVSDKPTLPGSVHPRCHLHRGGYRPYPESRPSQRPWSAGCRYPAAPGHDRVL